MSANVNTTYKITLYVRYGSDDYKYPTNQSTFQIFMKLQTDKPISDVMPKGSHQTGQTGGQKNIEPVG